GGVVPPALVVLFNEIEIPPVRDHRAIHWKKSHIGPATRPGPLAGFRVNVRERSCVGRDCTHGLGSSHGPSGSIPPFVIITLIVISTSRRYLLYHTREFARRQKRLPWPIVLKCGPAPNPHH